jgi:hypothetical protein
VNTNELLADAFARIKESVTGAVSGLSVDELSFRPDPEANSIAWLVWHLTRIQDDHVAGVAGVEQRWSAAAWQERFALPFAPGATGYGQTSDDVARVDVDASLLRDYFDAVHEVTVGYIGDLRPGDLDRIVDERWDPPVTLGVRLVSVVADNLEHAGQAAYLRGLAARRGLS